jgi:hypothetical protein
MQFIIPISPLFILFDVLLVSFMLFPLFIPTRWERIPFLQEKTYRLTTNSILIVVALIILYQHYDIALDITLGFLGQRV